MDITLRRHQKSTQRKINVNYHTSLVVCTKTISFVRHKAFALNAVF